MNILNFQDTWKSSHQILGITQGLEQDWNFAKNTISYQENKS